MAGLPRAKPKKSTEAEQTAKSGPVQDSIDEQLQTPSDTESRRPDAVTVPQAVAEQSRFRAFDQILSPVSKLIVLITIVLGGYEWFQTRQDDRIERTLTLIQSWNDQGLRDAYDEINTVIWPLYNSSAEQIEILVKDGADRGELLANIGRRVTDTGEKHVPGAARNVERLFEYFERAAVCSNERLCDYDVFNTFLGNEMRSFWMYFSSYAARKNATGYIGYGEWTERLAKGEIERRAFFGWL